MQNVNQPLGGTLTEVRRQRTARGLTQTKLAKTAGVSVVTIQRMEQHPRNRKTGISIESACAVARALEVELDALFPNTVLNYSQGRPVQSGGSYAIKTKTVHQTTYCPGCGTQVSVRERLAGQSDCCEAKLAL
jgi:transcriptional regulator with XRE-family HTH domain